MAKIGEAKKQLNLEISIFKQEKKEHEEDFKQKALQEKKNQEYFLQE